MQNLANSDKLLNQLQQLASTDEAQKSGALSAYLEQLMSSVQQMKSALTNDLQRKDQHVVCPSLCSRILSS